MERSPGRGFSGASRLFRPGLSVLLTVALAAWASGLTLRLHEASEGSHHQGEHCVVCKDLTTGAKAVAPPPLSVTHELRPVAVFLVAAQQVTLSLPESSVSARAPPLS